MKQTRKKMALSGIANLFAEKMPFNKLLGMQVTHYDFDGVELRIRMDEKLIGNPFHNILHGGVTATLLDVAGGMIVAASCIDELEEFSPDYLKERFARLGTIDLRVDYRGAATSLSPLPISSGRAARSLSPGWSCTTKRAPTSPSAPVPIWWVEPSWCIKNMRLIHF